MRVTDENSILSLQIGFNFSEQRFQNVPFLAIGYNSFATEVLRTGQLNYQEKFTSERWSKRVSE